MTKFSALVGRLETGTTNPSSPVVGQMYYDTTNNRFMRYNGTAWVGFAFTTSTSTSTTTSTSTSTSTTSTSSSTSTSTTSTSSSTSTS